MTARVPSSGRSDLLTDTQGRCALTEYDGP
jgi:hypothetical protein